MKFSFTLIFLILTGNFAFAQIEFCPPGAHWSAQFKSGGFPQSTTYNYQADAYYDGLDTLNGDTVKVLFSDQFFLYNMYPDHYLKYLKQKGDTVFINSIHTNNQWQILFNFGAQIGEKWFNVLQTSAFGSQISYTSEVVSSQTVLINGFSLKQLTINQTNNNYDDSFISYTTTERIGSNTFVFTFAGTGHLDGSIFGKNLCYSDSTFGTYYYGGNSCYVTTDVEKTTKVISSMMAFPIPSSSRLYLSFEAGFPTYNKCGYVITNTLGQLIKEGEVYFDEKDASIQIQNLNDGIYFLKLSTPYDSDFNETIRFVKMNE